MTPLLQMRTPGKGGLMDLLNAPQLLSGGAGVPGETGGPLSLGPGNTAEGHLRCVVSSDSPGNTETQRG